MIDVSLDTEGARQSKNPPVLGAGYVIDCVM